MWPTLHPLGASSITDLLDAEAALARAQAIQVQALGDYGIARATFQWALGELGPYVVRIRADNGCDPIGHNILIASPGYRGMLVSV